MPAINPKKIVFPIKGLDENLAYGSQPPMTTPGCSNVRSYDTLEKRVRGGQRPGLSAWYADEINSGATIQDINKIKAIVLKSDGLSAYMLASGGADKDELFKILLSDGTATQLFDVGTTKIIRGIAKDSAGNIYLTHQRATIGGNFRDVTKLDSTGTEIWYYDSGATAIGKPFFDDLRNRVIVSSDIGTLALDASGGALLWTGTDIDSANPNTVLRDSLGYYYVCTRGQDYNDGTGTIKRSFWKLDPDDGTVIWGFSFADGDTICYDADIDSDDNILVCASDEIATWGITATDQTASAANVWKMNTAGTVEWSALLKNTNQDEIRAIQWSSDGNFYIGIKGITAEIQGFQKIVETTRAVSWDYSIGTGTTQVNAIHEDTDGVYVYVGGTRTANWENTDASSASVWKLPIGGGGTLPTWHSDTGGDTLRLSAKVEGTAAEATAIDVMSLVSEGDIYSHRGGTVQTVTGGADALVADAWVMSQAAYSDIFFVDGSSSLRYNIDYTLTNDTVEVWFADEGSVPTNCKLIALYRGRMVLSGSDADPHNWFMSKVGDPFDFDYAAANTAIVAVAGNNSEAGLIGDIITAIIPFTDDICIFGGDHTIWAMSGDPAAGGSIDQVSDQVGIAFGRAWAKDPNGVLYFFGVDGVYRLVPGEKPESMTDGRIKKRMEAIDLSTHRVVLAWDSIQQGLVVQVIKKDYSTVAAMYFWDYRTDSWWVDSYPAAMGPTSIFMYDSDAADDRALLFGCKDGYLRKIDAAAATDDSTNIDNHVYIGPYAGGGNNLIIKGLDVTLANSSGNLDLSLIGSDVPQNALTDSVKIKRTLKAGKNHLIRQRLMANNITLKLSQTTQATTWALESIDGKITPAGMARRGRV